MNVRGRDGSEISPILSLCGLITTLSAIRVEFRPSACGPAHPSPFTGPPGGFSSRPPAGRLVGVKPGNSVRDVCCSWYRFGLLLESLLAPRPMLRLSPLEGEIR